MASFSGPNIVDDELLVAYDAANTKSYRGSALINRYYTQTGNSANTNIWDKVGLSASTNVAIDSSRGTWNGNTIFKATVAASGSYLSYQSIRKCIAASHNTAIGTSRRLTFKVRMLEPSSTAISNISYHNGGGTAGHNSSHFTLLDESEVPADSIIKDNWYLLELDVSGTYGSGHCVGIGLPSAHSQAVTFLFTELMVYSSADSGSEPQPFTPTERLSYSTSINTDGLKNMTGTNTTFDGEFNGTYQNNDNKKSIVFDGSTDHIITGLTRGDLGNTLTIVVWYKYTGSSNRTYTAIIGGKESGSGTEFFIGKNTGNTNIGVQDGNYSSTFVTGSNAFDGNWHQIVYTYDSGTGKIYLDGTLKSSGSFTKCNDAEEIMIGIEFEGSNYPFPGNMSQILMYTRVLTAAEVTQNFNALRGRFGI
jgi:hypothetical protein